MEKSKKIRAKRKRAMKRKIKLFLFTIIIIGTSIFLVKSSVFNIENIKIQASENINKQELLESCGFIKDRNIFLLKHSDLKPIIDSNNYIEDIIIKKQGINTVKLEVKEAKVKYYYQLNDSKYILNNDFKVLEVTTEKIKSSLIKLEGLNFNHKSKGEILEITDIQKKILHELSPYIDEIQKNKEVSAVNVGNIINIVMRINNVDVIIGEINNLEDKLNIALNILDDEKIGIKSGYINVSVVNVPVINKVEEVEEVEENILSDDSQ